MCPMDISTMCQLWFSRDTANRGIVGSLRKQEIILKCLMGQDIKDRIKEL